MAVPSNTTETYDSTLIRESLQDALVNINPADHTGVPRRAQSAERTIQSIVRNLGRELNGEFRTIDVYNAAAEQSIDEDTVDRMLRNIQIRGDIYAPSIGVWRIS